MRKVVFKATIKGHDLVRRTGPIRMPTCFRIRVYDDGEAVITTRGRWEDVFNRAENTMTEYTKKGIVDRLTKLEKESRQATSGGARPTKARAK